MNTQSSSLTQAHLEQVRAAYDDAPTELNWAARGYRKLLAHYYNLLIPADASVLEIGCGSGDLLSRLNAARKTGVDLSPHQIASARLRVPEADFHIQAGEFLDLPGTFDYIVVSDTLNLAADVQQLLARLQAVSHPNTRLILNYHSSLWRPLFVLAGWAGQRSPRLQSNWLATADVLNLLQLADWSAISIQCRLLLPVPCHGLEALVNRWLAPLLQWFWWKPKMKPSRHCVPTCSDNCSW